MSFVVSPAGSEQLTQFAISPDGQRIAYVGVDQKTTQLYLRVLGDAIPRRLSGTDGASIPFFSPDGNWIGFFTTSGEMKRISVSDGSIMTIARNVTSPSSRPVWMKDGRILLPTRAFTQQRSGLSQIAVNGGASTPVIRADSVHGENLNASLVLDDGRTVLVQSQGPGGLEDDVFAIGSLDRHDHTTTNLLIAEPLAFVDGHLVAAQWDPPLGKIIAVPVDVANRKITGDPITLLENTGNVPTMSPSGTIAYTSGAPFTELVSTDAAGKTDVILSGERNYTSPRLSPDGKRIAFLLPATGSPAQDISMLDIGTQTVSKLSSGGATQPEWAPDGKRIVFIRATTAAAGLWVQTIDLSAPAERLHPVVRGGGVPSYAIVAPDNKTIMFVASTGRRSRGIFYYDPSVSDSVTAWPPAAADELEPHISPNGKWVVYTSNESGSNEVYLRSFSGIGGRTQVSSGGGDKATWSADGATIYYRNGSSIMASSFTAAPAPAVANRRTAFSVNSILAAPAAATYDISHDGKHVLFARPAGGNSRLIVTTNWLAGAMKKVREAKR